MVKPMKDKQIPRGEYIIDHNPLTENFSYRNAILLGSVFFLVFVLTFSSLTYLFSELGSTAASGFPFSASNRRQILDDEKSSINRFPDTTNGIHVFNDQLATWDMSEEQFKFSATHYAGTQKVFASDARRFRAYNPEFVVLNYRLGLGLGYQTVGNNCDPNGNWIELIDGEKWVREYPDNPLDEWFYRINGERVFSCDWGWYLVDISNPEWRGYWTNEVLRQLISNKADGVFVDSLFPPNYMGGSAYSPPLPDIDSSFEKEWSKKIEDFLSHIQSGELEDFHVIVNVGAWITSRDNTDYSGADGIFVEGFARWPEGQYFDFTEQDWHLQMNRILGQTSQNKIIILQQYIDPRNISDRVFILGNYLLIKGKYTFINMEYSSPPEWFPEYEISIGEPVDDIPKSISDLFRSDWNVYVRNYSNGMVIVNPSNKGQSIELFQDYFQVIPYGGGTIPDDVDISDWALDFKQTSFVELDANEAVILLSDLPK